MLFYFNTLIQQNSDNENWHGQHSMVTRAAYGPRAAGPIPWAEMLLY